jgi:hypothetical protein
MAGELRATVLTAVKGDAAEKLGKQLDGLSGKLKNFGSIASKAAKGLVGIGSALVSSKFIGDSVEQAKNLERSLLGLDTIFGDLAPRMEQFSKDAANIGLSQSEAAKASVFLGSVLQQYGVESNVAADQTEKLVGLAADLAATYGYDVQESLLAMTALFRGEYDPIEKFGVAMKQNEIEAVKAARGMDKLTGAEEMNADVNIRLELLYERTAMAQGAVARGADTLYVQQEKLRATFENLQAQLGAELIPVFAELFEQLRPIIEDATPALIQVFRAVGEVISELGQLFVDIFDPTTEIGESFAALKIQLDSLWETVFGRDFDISAIFDGVEWFIGLIVDALHDLIMLIDNTVIGFKVMGDMLTALFTGDWNRLVNTDWTGQIRSQIEVKDALNETRLAAEKLNAEMAKTADARIGQMDTYLEFLNRRAREAGLDSGKKFGEGFGEGTGEKTKDIVADFFAGIDEEIAKQQARSRLQSLGASSGLIEQILGSGEDWQKVFDAVLARGKASLKEVQELFNQTAAGMKELEAVAERQLQWMIYQSNAYDRQVARAQEVVDANNVLITQQNQLANSFRETRDSLLENYAASLRSQEGLGVYTQAVVDLGSALNELIESNPYKGETGLFSSGSRRNLISSTNTILGAMRSIAEQRDEIGSRLETAKSLVQSISDSIFGSFNITNIQGKAKDIIQVFRDTVSQTRDFAEQLRRLRSAGLTDTALEQIISAGAQAGSQTAQALLEGGPSAIREINSLFTQLEDVSMQIGEDVATSMYGEGIDITNGLVEGMLSQQSALEMAATQLATAFQSAFTNATEATAIRLTSPSIFQIMGDYPLSYGTTGVTPMQRSSGTYNITVNAGMGTDGQSVGQIIIDEIKKFERQSGRVFVSA